MIKFSLTGIPKLELGRAGRRLDPALQNTNIIEKLGKDYQVIKDKTGEIIGLEEKGYSLFQAPNNTLFERTELPNYLYQITYNKNGAITSLLEKKAGEGGFYITKDLLNGEILSTKIPPSEFL